MAAIVIAGNKHLAKPNIARNSVHRLIYPKKFPLGRFPLEEMWSPFENLAAWQPVGETYQLVHSFNAIPVINKPFLITFELFLPYLSVQNSKSFLEVFLYDRLKESLASQNCRRIIAISNYAKSRFIKKLSDWNSLELASSKLEVIHPSFPVQASRPKSYEGESLDIIFIGSHFARKGGIVALRLAKKALDRGLPITLHIVSDLKYSSGVPTDFPDPNRYAADLKLLDLPNVISYGKCSNQVVLQLLNKCHFQMLATLEDTYGYSVLEGFSTATPAIVTDICALPELVQSNVNGYLLNLDKSKSGNWAGYEHWKAVKTGQDSNSDRYWERLNQTYDNLADQALEQLTELLDQSNRSEIYEKLSFGALNRAETVHNAQTTSDRLDELYNQILAEL